MNPVLIQIDAFTDTPFGGNPAAVCLLQEAQDAEWMQAVAAEMNLSETAFVWPLDDGFSLRWFTPTMEVDLCGHATLAAGHALLERGDVPADATITFHTKSGRLQATARDGKIWLDFPNEAATECLAPTGLLEGLQVSPTFVGRNRRDYLVEVASEDVVRGIDPDFRLLSGLPLLGVIVTSQSSSDVFDFVSRYFAPAAGIDEDPVTGSAHCCSGPHWAQRLGRNKLVAYQASARGGIVHVEVTGDRVQLGGQAVTVLQGELT